MLPMGSTELRGPTRDEAVLLRMRLPPILPLAAPDSGEADTGKEALTQAQQEEEKEEAKDIEEEFAEMLNEEGKCLFA